MKTVKILAAVLISGVFQLKSQDFHLSMYDSGPLFLNPAMTGVIDTKMRFHAQYRNQWKAVAYKPYTTALVSFDMPYKEKWGFGGQIINMRAGEGGYNAFQFLGSGGYTLPIDKPKYHIISMGMQLGFTQKSVREERYSFDSQYTPANGGSFDKNIDNLENFNRVSQILPQLNTGFMYYYAKQQCRVNPFLGISGFNLTHPKETFFDMNNRLPLRWVLHTGTRININEEIYVLPKILLMKQGKAFEHTYALDAGYYLKQGQIFIIGGFIYRAQDAAIISLGAKKLDYTVRFSYDINTSSLKTVSRSRGAFEVSLTYLYGREKVSKVKHCPRI